METTTGNNAFADQTDYRLVFQRGPDCQVVLDDNLRILDATDEWENILGIDRQHSIGKTFKDLFPQTDISDDLNVVMDALERVRSNQHFEELPTFRYDIPKQQDGEYLPKFWRTYSYPLVDNGETRYLIHRLHDVTEQVKENKTMELDLRTDVFKTMVENIKDYALLMLDVKGNVRTWNPGAKRLIGYDSEDIIGKHFSIFYPEEDKKNGKPEQELERVLKNGKEQVENWRIRKDGSKFWADVLMTTAKDQNGRLLGFVKIVRDLTERRESELRSDVFRMMVENVKDYAIFMLDVHGNILTWNQGAKRLNGYDTEEIVGKHFSIFYSEEDKKAGKPDREIREILEHGKVEDEDWRVRKDGSKYWANVIITTIKDKQGNLVGFVKVVRDLSERRAAEQRTISAYEESAKLKSEFLANMSHEIRTPMNGIMSAANLLKSTPLNQEQQDLVDILLQSGDSMVKLTNDILDYSKMESDRIYVVTDPFDLIQEITDIVHNYEKMVKGPVQMKLQISNSVPRWVKGDRLRFHQVLSNLVDNAVKFTNEGDIDVTVVVRVEDRVEPDKTFRLVTEVKDTGIGISEDDMERLFSPFSQLEAFATKRYRGTGLGLAISRRSVQLMGGDIKVESELGKGSKFTFTVTLLGMDQTKKNDKELGKPSDTDVRMPQSHEIRILIAEDNRINQTVAIRVLKKLGYQHVLLAENGQEAVTMFAQEHPDVILMDIQMPVMDGYEATKEIRKLDKNIPIIAMTANALKGDMEKCLEAGMNGYIPKPINIPNLAKMLKGDNE